MLLWSCIVTMIIDKSATRNSLKLNRKMGCLQVRRLRSKNSQSVFELSLWTCLCNLTNHFVLNLLDLSGDWTVTESSSGTKSRAWKKGGFTNRYGVVRYSFVMTCFKAMYFGGKGQPFVDWKCYSLNILLANPWQSTLWYDTFRYITSFRVSHPWLVETWTYVCRLDKALCSLMLIELLWNLVYSPILSLFEPQPSDRESFSLTNDTNSKTGPSSCFQLEI